MGAYRLSLDWGDFVYFFWAYLWKSIEFLRVDRLFNDQGAFQVHCFVNVLLFYIIRDALTITYHTSSLPVCPGSFVYVCVSSCF
jgi:hypothetical protein